MQPATPSQTRESQSKPFMNPQFTSVTTSLEGFSYIPNTHNVFNQGCYEDSQPRHVTDLHQQQQQQQQQSNYQNTMYRPEITDYQNLYSQTPQYPCDGTMIYAYPGLTSIPSHDGSFGGHIRHPAQNPFDMSDISIGPFDPAGPGLGLGGHFDLVGSCDPPHLTDPHHAFSTSFAPNFCPSNPPSNLYTSHCSAIPSSSGSTSGYHSSPAGSSHTSNGSDESDEFYGFAGTPYKRHPVQHHPAHPGLVSGGSPPAAGPTAPCAPAPQEPTSAAAARRARQGKKRKPRRDPNEPQKPVSAYALFFRDTQATIKGSNPNASFGEVSKIVASLWDSLDVDAKNKYKQRTENAKKDYLKQLAAYRANQVSKGGNTTLEGFAQFSQQQKSGTGSSNAGVAYSPDSTTPNINGNPNPTTNGTQQQQLNMMNGNRKQQQQQQQESASSCDPPTPTSMATMLLANKALGQKTLASLIAEPCPQQILTATTTLTVPQLYMPNRNIRSDPFEKPTGITHTGTEIGPGQTQIPLSQQNSSASEASSVDSGLQWHQHPQGFSVPPHCRDVYSGWMQPTSQQGPVSGTFAPV